MCDLYSASGMSLINPHFAIGVILAWPVGEVTYLLAVFPIIS